MLRPPANASTPLSGTRSVAMGTPNCAENSIGWEEQCATSEFGQISAERSRPIGSAKRVGPAAAATATPWSGLGVSRSACSSAAMFVLILVPLAEGLELLRTLHRVTRGLYG